jgi:prephenate dehydrogenase
MDAAAHDAAAAGISHLPLVVAAALAEAVAGAGTERPGWPAAAALAASGWRDMTRLARGDETMAAGIAVTNATALAGQVRAVQAELDAWLAELEAGDGPDADRIRERFAAIRRRLDDPAR